MKKLILKYINSNAGKVSFRIKEQSHRGNDFGDNGSYFDAKNDLMIASDGYPAVYNQRKLSFYCRGRNRDSDNSEVTVTYSIWEEIKVAVKEYNEYNCYYGECILDDSTNVIKDIVPMKMFIIE